MKTNLARYFLHPFKTADAILAQKAPNPSNVEYTAYGAMVIAMIAVLFLAVFCLVIVPLDRVMRPPAVSLQTIYVTATIVGCVMMWLGCVFGVAITTWLYLCFKRLRSRFGVNSSL